MEMNDKQQGIKRPRPRLTEALAQEARDLQSTYSTATAIAAALGKKHGMDIKAHQVRVAIKNAEQPVKLGRPVKGTAEQHEKLMRLLARWRNAARVARTMLAEDGLKISSVAIQQKAKLAGIELVGHKKKKPRRPRSKAQHNPALVKKEPKPI